MTGMDRRSSGVRRRNAAPVTGPSAAQVIGVTIDGIATTGTGLSFRLIMVERTIPDTAGKYPDRGRSSFAMILQETGN